MSDIAELEAQKVRNAANIKRAEMAERLGRNNDFKKLILEDFCEKECARSARLSGDMNLDAQGRADAIAIAQAAGHLLRFLSAVKAMGRHAEGQNLQIDEVLDEIRAADAEDSDYTGFAGDEGVAG